VFQQIFHRTGVSLSGPGRPGMPIVLASEYAAGLKGVATPEELLTMARTAGLEQEALTPVCMGIMQSPQSSRQSQRFFLVFESEAFSKFRQELVRRREAQGAPGVFDPAGLRPIVPVASFEADFHRWWPFQVDIARDCQTRLILRTP
jgi:hypothetical protein